MTAEMRKSLARLPYAEKLQRVAELIEFSRRFKAVKTPGKTDRTRKVGMFTLASEPPIVSP